MKNTTTNSHNPIESLRHLESPVSEQEWAAITSDRRYVRKFGRKTGLSPKGRIAAIASAVALLVALPVLVRTLDHKTTGDSPSAKSGTEAATFPRDEQSVASSTPASAPAAVPSQTTATPAKTSVTASAALHENSSLPSVMANRQPAFENQPAETEAPRSNPISPRFNLQDIQKTPERHGGLEHANTETLHTVYSCSPSTQEKSGTSETTVLVEGEEAAKYNPSPDEEPAPDAEKFFIPSAFTPNGDGLNDLFYVNANFEPRNYELSIFNRNGDLVFLTRDMHTGWDGQMRGRTLPQGMYVYIIKYKDGQGNDQRKQGQILLVP